MSAPYTFVPTKDFSIDFDGEKVQLRKGEGFPLRSACAAVRFFNAVQKQTGSSVNDFTLEGMRAIVERCEEEAGAGAPAVDPPAEPPPNPDPSTTGQDAPAPGNVETPETLNAPEAQVNAEVRSEPRPPGQSDGRSLNEQYFDPDDPMPDYDVASLLSDSGTPAGDLDDAVEQVKRNEPPPGQRHPHLSDDDRTDPEALLDPVVVFSGAFSLTAADVTIASVGMPLELRRSYRSGVPHYGPWGFNWDHNYDVYLRELDDGAVAVWNGRHGEEVHEPDPAGGFAPPVGVFRLLERRPGPPDGYELSEAEGMRLLFERPPGWPLPERIPLLRVEDRHGNAQRLAYDVAGRLASITDDAGRFIEFSYDDRGLLEWVGDHAGRRWRYELDPDTEDLIRVTAPATADHPGGTTTRYEYDRFQEHPVLRHNLIRVVDGGGRPVVDNEYGTDPGSDDFGRVVRQQFAGFEATYRATQLQFVPRTPEAVNVPALRVEVMDPGVLHVLTFNYRGDVLDERFRLTLDGSFRLVATTSRYDPQGNLVERREPDGHGYLYEYDHENLDPRARGNLLRVTEVASPLAPAPARILLRATYEPRYQLPKTLRDAAGEVTEWVWDHEAAVGGTGRLTELRRPAVTRPDGSRQKTVERYLHNAAGQLERHELGGAVHRFTYDPAGYLRERRHTGGGATIVERYERDAVGNLTARVDGVGNRTEYRVNAQNQVEQVLTPDGAAWAFHYDGAGRLTRAEEPRGALPAAIVADPVVVHEFEFDPLGFLVGEVRAANSNDPRRYRYRRSAEGGLLEAVDPLGRRLTRRLDERGQVLQEELRASDGTLAYRRQYRYERSGQLRRVGLEGEPPVRLRYDGFSMLRSVETADRSRVTYVHDTRGLLTEARITGPPPAGAGVGPLLAVRRWDLDERGMPRGRIERLFTNPAGPVTDVVTAMWLDAEGRPERIDEPSGLTLRRTYSATGTLLEERDSLGNRVSWILDAAGRPAELLVVEQPTAGGPAISHRWSRGFDARGRVIAETDPLGNSVSTGYDARGMPVAARNPGGLPLTQQYDAHDRLRAVTVAGATMEFRRDGADRVVEVVDPTRTVTGFGYDAQDRLVEVRRVDGRTQTRTYDPSGALRRLVDFDGSRIDYTNSPVGQPERIDTVPAGVAVAVPPTELSYDGLGRIVRAAAGPVVHTFTYDSLGRLLEDAGTDVVRFVHDARDRRRILRYPDGRRDRFEYDELGRLRTVTLLTDGSLGLAGQGLNVGGRLAAWEWDGQVRPGGAAGAAGLTCTYEYDGAARLVARRAADAAGGRIYEESSLRDAVGRRRAVWRAAPVPRGEEYRYDDLGRVRRARLGLPGGSVPSSSAGLDQAAMDAAIAAAAAGAATLDVEMAYAPGGTPQSRTDRDGAGAVLAARAFTDDPLHQLATVDGAPVRYDDAGNLVEWGTRRYLYDAFHRLVEVRDGGVLSAQFVYDGLGRLHRRTVGGTTTRLAYAGDEVIQATGAAGVRAQFVSGPNLDQPPLVSVPGQTHLLVHDLIGSLTAVCDLAGSVQERFRYDLFGLPTVLAPDGVTVRPGPTLGIAPRFGGRPWLQECGLYDFRARGYDPRLFVFLQPDPYPFANGWCPYAFVGYDPLDNVDPFGTVLFTVVIGAVAGLVIGGVGAALNGGDIGDILVGAGVGALGGAIAGAGMPVLGAAVAGGLMGAWTGGRIGYQLGGAEGAVVGALGGGVTGAALGVVAGGIGSRVGNVVATRATGLIYRGLVNRGVTNATRTVISRYGGQVLGGYVGGTTGGLVTNSTVSMGVDLATDDPITPGQFWDATVQSLAVDGPLNAVGAPLHRRAMLGKLPGRLANVLGAEGELLVGRQHNLDPANGSQRILVGGRERRPDFPTGETLRRFEAVFEVKNKARLSNSDVAQLQDFATVAANNNAELVVFERPGAGLSAQVPGLNNVRFAPIPQRPLVVTVPTVAVAPLVAEADKPK